MWGSRTCRTKALYYFCSTWKNKQNHVRCKKGKLGQSSLGAKYPSLLRRRRWDWNCCRAAEHAEQNIEIYFCSTRQNQQESRMAQKGKPGQISLGGIHRFTSNLRGSFINPCFWPTHETDPRVHFLVAWIEHLPGCVAHSLCIIGCPSTKCAH